MRNPFRKDQPVDPDELHDLRDRLDQGMRCWSATGGGEYFDGYTDALASLAAKHADTDPLTEVLASANRVGIDPANPKLKARR